VLDEGVATLYCHEVARWTAAERDNLAQALSILYRIAMRWVQAGSPLRWQAHQPRF